MTTKMQPRVETDKETETPRIKHYAHPTDPDKAWCGAQKPNPSGVIGVSSWRHTPCSCVVCHHIWLALGTDGWDRGELPRA